MIAETKHRDSWDEHQRQLRRGAARLRDWHPRLRYRRPKPQLSRKYASAIEDADLSYRGYSWVPRFPGS